MSSSEATPWGDFTHDPRRSEAAPLRASDRDRDVVVRVLGEAYADGRLTREEYDERADATTQARTLGELPAIIADLVPQQAPATRSSLALASPSELRSMAVREYEKSRREAFSGMVVVTTICTVIWLATGGGFFWPAFVLLGTGVNVLRMLLQRTDMVEDRQRALEKKQRKALQAPPPEPEDA